MAMRPYAAVIYHPAPDHILWPSGSKEQGAAGLEPGLACPFTPFRSQFVVDGGSLCGLAFGSLLALLALLSLKIKWHEERRSPVAGTMHFFVCPFGAFVGGPTQGQQWRPTIWSFRFWISLIYLFAAEKYLFIGHNNGNNGSNVKWLYFFDHS